MISTSLVRFCPAGFRRMRLSLFLPTIACLLLSVSSHAQVIFKGSPPNVNFGSVAVGSTSAPATLSFTIASTANTQVGSIAVVTTGIAGKDFAAAAGSTCAPGDYTASTPCTVNVTFHALVSGMRMGAVVFTSGPGGSGTVLATVPVYGIGTGPQLVFGLGGARSTVGHGLISPAGVAVDAANNAYISDLDSQKVFKVAPNGAQTMVASGFSVPEAVAVDGAGNVYVADSYASAVFKVTPGGVQTTIGSGFSYPIGLAVDGAGNVYVSDPFVDAVFKVTPAGTQTMVGGGFNTPVGVAVDAAGNVYVADTFNQVVYKITPGGVQTTLPGTLTSPATVAVDAAADVYITDDGANVLYKISPSGVQSTLVTDLDAPDGVALDGAGDIYIADSNSSKVLRIERANSPSLHFDSTKKGSTSKDSPRTVYAQNIGNAALLFSGLTYPKDFPEGSGKNDCTSSTSLASAYTCSLPIDFSPVTSLGGKKSITLYENVTLTTNNLNMHTVDKVHVSGTETAK